MPGFNNGVMYANNVRFDGAAYPGEVTADGQLLIGSTAAPNIRVNTLTPGTGVSITNGPGTIEISAVGSGMTTLEISVNTTLASNTCYLVEDNLGTGLPLNLTLPASPVIGDVIEIISYENTWVLVGPNHHFVELGGNPFANNIQLGGGNHGTVTSLFTEDVIRLRFCGTVPGKGGSPIYYNWVAEDVIGNIQFYNDIEGAFTANSVGISSVGIPYYDGAGLFSSISTTQYAPLVGDALNNIASVGPLADGEILIGSTGNNPVPATLTQGSNITITPAPGSITISATTPPGIKVTTYNVGTTTWYKDPRTAEVHAIGWSGGGGGGSGRQGLTAASSGGGGGGCGPVFNVLVPSSFFGNSETIVVGSGGAGGAAQTVALTSGNNGSPGGTTKLGNIWAEMKNATYNYGGGGSTTSGGGGTGGGGQTMGISLPSNTSIGSGTTGQPAAVSATANVGPNTTSASAICCPTGGGGGSGANSTTANQAGVGGGLYTLGSTLILAGSPGGIETGTIDGTPGSSQPTSGGAIFGGTGGGGGGGQRTGLVAGNGGKGGFPGGGGGGGGGSLSGTNSGKGGDGGDGYIIIIEYLQ